MDFKYDTDSLAVILVHLLCLQDDDGETPLWKAAYRGEHSCVNSLLVKGMGIQLWY